MIAIISQVESYRSKSGNGLFVGFSRKIRRYAETLAFPFHHVQAGVLTYLTFFACLSNKLDLAIPSKVSLWFSVKSPSVENSAR